MKRKTIIIIALLLSVLPFLNKPALAWKASETHRLLARYAADNSVLSKSKGDYLKILGFDSGLDEDLEWGEETKTVKEWLADGAEFEDNSDWLTLVLYGQGRYSNHFHDPLKSWESAGLDDWLSGYHLTGESSLLWAQDREKQAYFTEGDWTWQRIRESYYSALISEQKTLIDEYLAQTFRGLGHQMHLIQDCAVPYHVRNDAHFEKISGWKRRNVAGTSLFENWAADNTPIITPFASNPVLPAVQFDISHDGLSPISQLIDTDQYDGTNPTADLTQGLAEYTNANFFSEDTVFAAERFSEGDRHYFPYPKASSTDLQNYINKLPETVIAEDGVSDSNIYIAKKTGDGESIDHFVTATYLTHDIYLYESDWQLFERTFYLDEKCHHDYTQKLIPRAVGYSAALLDYFFRGRLEVTAIPNFIDNQIDGIWLKIKNVTPTGEDMTMTDDDRLVLVCRYTPEGANPDGSEDKFVMANTYSCIEGECDTQGNLDGIQNGDEATIYFYLPEEEENQIGMQIVKSAEKSVKCMLVFKGKLGEEETAVIGKYFTLGKDQVRFNEEWDNGPTGNYPWEHISCCSDNGSASNIVENSILIKDNTRYKYSTEWHFNQSYIELVNTENSEGIHITPDTYVEMKIDDMSIDASNPDIHWQALNLIFNDEILIQFTQEGQNNYNNYAYRFNLGENTVVNIYSLFDFFGIEMPSQLYLTRIDIVQQFYEPENPPGNDENQHMEVDSIRIVEGKHEE